MPTQSNIRIIFFDIDGTLYRKESDTLPNSVATAIRELKKRDIIPAIATGRALAALPDKIRSLVDAESIELFVTINGQYNQYQGKALTDHPIDLQDLNTVIAKLNAAGIAYGLIANDHMAVSADTPAVQRALATIGRYEINPNYHHGNPVYQMLIFCEADAEQHIRDNMLPANYQTIRWHKEGMDMLPADGSKIRGIKEVCDALSIDMANVMAFGDGLNDVEMLQGVGIGIAMSDGHEKARAAAKDSTDPLEENGILNALRRYGLAD